MSAQPSMQKDTPLSEEGLARLRDATNAIPWAEAAVQAAERAARGDGDRARTIMRTHFGLRFFVTWTPAWPEGYAYGVGALWNEAITREQLLAELFNAAIEGAS